LTLLRAWSQAESLQSLGVLISRVGARILEGKKKKKKEHAELRFYLGIKQQFLVS
jgi:hypothetical protein